MLPNKVFSAVLWDIDGTLIDSEPLHDEAVLATLKSMGMSNNDAELDMLGVTWDQTWAKLGGTSDQLADFEERTGDYYVRNISRLRPRDNALDWVAKFHAAGIQQAAVSNSRRKVVEANLNHLNIMQMMGAVISLDDCLNSKPHPEPYLNAATCLKQDASLCVAVEDSPRGMLSAKTAGAFSIFWPQNEQLVSSDCDIKINRLDDFPWMSCLRPTPSQRQLRRLHK